MLARRFLVSPAIARYMAAPVWLSFIFLLDPVNAHLGAESLWRDWRARPPRSLINLILSGFLVRRPVGAVELLVARQVDLHGADQWSTSRSSRCPVPGYSRLPAFAL